MRVRLETSDLSELLPAFGADAASFPFKLAGGGASFDGTVAGALGDPRITGRLSAGRFSYGGTVFDSLSGEVTASAANARMDGATLVRGAARAQFQAAVNLRDWATVPESEVFGTATVHATSLPELADLAGWNDGPISGSLAADAQLAGTVARPILESSLEISRGAYSGEPFDRFTARVRYADSTLDLTSGQIAAGSRQARIGASYRFAADNFSTGLLRFDVSGGAMPIEQFQIVHQSYPYLSGTVQAAVRGSLEFRPPRPGQRAAVLTDLHAQVDARGMTINNQRLSDLRIVADSGDGSLRAELEGSLDDSKIHGEGTWKLEEDYPGSARITFSKYDLAHLYAWLSTAKARGPAPIAGSAEGEVRIDGPLLKFGAIRAELRIRALEIGPAQTDTPSPFTLRNDGPLVATMANSVVSIESAHLAGRAGDLTISGRVLPNGDQPFDLRIGGQLDLAAVAAAAGGLTASGTAAINATVRGSFGDPQVGGRAEIRNLSLTISGLPNGLDNCSGAILFNRDRATIETLHGETGGGPIEFTGFMGFSTPTAFRLYATAHGVRIRFPEGMSNTVDGNLNLTGTSERSQLAGAVTVLRSALSLGTDVGSVLDRAPEPVQTPSVRTGWLGGLSFDVQIQTAPDIRVQSSLTQDMAVQASSLRLRGTVSNPVLLGRVNITQGQVQFYGTRYDINQGALIFSNASSVDPVLDVDLETKARGLDVTLNLAGPIGKLKVTPRSDPPLQLSEIVALLASGQAPLSDPTTLARQSVDPNSFQQLGASALLGQAVASPVFGRLQRLFGVSRLRIDPTLPGVEYNPQARLTLEQQVTPSITFTYITIINSSNPQIVSMQWDVNRQWTVRMVREENGVFGVDFLVKKQFR